MKNVIKVVSLPFLQKNRGKNLIFFWKCVFALVCMHER